jgi:tetratricopeptide (TPR) repeat protein
MLARIFKIILIAGLLALVGATGSMRAQAPRRLSVRAVHYDVAAKLMPAEQLLSARAKVDFEISDATHVIEVELHPNLRVTAVTGADGRPVTFDRDENSPLIVRVTLPEMTTAGQKLSLTFEYVGPLSGTENSPVKGLRLASISSDGAYLLLPARWFPLTDYPANRYTATFSIDVPEGLTVAGSGKTSPPSPPSAATMPPVSPASASTSSQPPVLTHSAKGKAPTKAPEPIAPAPAPARTTPPATPSGPRMVYTFHNDRPGDSGSFVVGNLQLSPAQSEGVDIAVYAGPNLKGVAVAQAEVLGRIITEFSGEFGALPDPNLVLAPLPEGTLPSFTGPGLLLLSQRNWASHVDYRTLAQLAAKLWWGEQVQAASAGDVWLTDGLSRYCEGLYVEQIAGKEGFNRALDDFAVGALMYEDAAPISQAMRLQPYSAEYRSVVVNKGAMVFHMLRAQLGDDAFKSLLRDFYAKYAGKSASIEDFRKLADTKAQPHGDQPAPNLAAFFAQWLSSTGVPEFKVEYVVYRIKKGFQIVGKVKQDLETFHMPVEMRVDTEGNPEIKIVEVVGSESDFTVDTFGRPKFGMNGITLDPNNHILKASNKLRVRASIARGEEMAEQGKYYDAIQQYQKALSTQKNNSLAHFRIGEAFFYQKNYNAAANSFREAIDGDLDLSYKWVEVWSHIYLGKIFDISGQRERAVNEYSKAKQTNDDTGGAQDEVTRLIAQPYKEEAVRMGNP